MPDAIVVDSNGLIYIADRGNFRVRVVGAPCANLAVNDHNNSKKVINVYPNPATTTLKITAPGIIQQVAMSNYFGQTIYTHQYNAEEIEINVEDLPTGMYFVTINNSEVRKFVKQ